MKRPSKRTPPQKVRYEWVFLLWSQGDRNASLSIVVLNDEDLTQKYGMLKYFEVKNSIFAYVAFRGPVLQNFFFSGY